MALRFTFAFLSLAILFLSHPAPTLAGKRVALVIGNGRYESSPLRNPVNDAQDVAAALKGLGFSVILRTDATRRAMVDAARDFEQQAQAAEAALFFYAGHGMQVRGANYLLPVGANVAQENEVEFEAVDANLILSKMESSGAKVVLVVLDACRDNPFRSFRSSSRGLAVLNAGSGSVIAYATRPGDVAADGSGRNSPFTKHLLQHLATPGLTVKGVFDRVGAGVQQETGGRQVPWISSSLYTDFFLAGPAPAAPAGPGPDTPARPAVAGAGLAEAEADYRRMQALFTENLVTRQDLEQAEARYLQAKAAEAREGLARDKASLAEQQRLAAQRRAMEAEQARLAAERQKLEEERTRLEEQRKEQQPVQMAMGAAPKAPKPVLSTEAVKVGVLSDLSGPTSDVGRPYADGIVAAAAWINEQGGVAGRSLELIQVDYAYNVQQALAAYRSFLSRGVVAIQGWGAGDTQALAKFVAKDRIPIFTAGSSADLTDPGIAPYTFFTTADYSTQLRAALKHLRATFRGQGAPRLALLYPNHPFGLSPIQACKDYINELGFILVAEEHVDLKATDATPQLRAMQRAAPDYCWIGGTSASAAVILRDAGRLGVKTQFFINAWGNDENLAKLAGDAAEGVLGLQGAANYLDAGPGGDLIRRLTRNQPQMTHYVRGFASMLVMAEGIRRAASRGPLTGESVKAALETLRDFDPMGLAPAVSYLPNDHRPNMSVNLYRFQDGKMARVATSTLERRAEWLGK